ncbi:hypothetical protein Pla110_18710 [Polystyrenella longa]|uniref:Uncharacterized protein n=1 Tax=Polystyrenella longa TaxID=2528007 RepID=A0A518CLP1_9PLAN|nr:hypothetical protein [Polystyrenella longa]QDU80148.1 hypothetical protein Pla110_18710 [Polystyrenella longa]
MSFTQLRDVFVFFSASIVLATMSGSSAEAGKVLGYYGGGNSYKAPQNQHKNFNRFHYHNQQKGRQYGIQRHNNIHGGNYSNYNQYGYGTGHIIHNGSNGSQYEYQNRNSKRTNSGVIYNRSGTTGLGVSTMTKKGYGRDGSFSHGPNGTNVNYGQTSPGPIYGTQQRTWTDINYKGRDSQVQYGQDLSVLGGNRIGGRKTTINRHGYNDHRGGRIGSVHGHQAYGVQWKGKNSNVHYEQGGGVGGAKAKGRASIDRKGAHGKASVGVGKHKVKAKANISTSGSSFQVGGAKVRF